MSKSISIIVVIQPMKGKTDEVIALLNEHADYVKANELGTQAYEIHRSLRPADDGTEDIVMIEKYSDSKALEIHGSDEAFRNLQKKLAMAGCMRAPPILKVVSPTESGFSSRL